MNAKLRLESGVDHPEAVAIAVGERATSSFIWIGDARGYIATVKFTALAQFVRDHEARIEKRRARRRVKAK